MDTVAEEQAKLGYRREPVRLYYPLSSLNHFFGTDASASQMQELLVGFNSFADKRLGQTQVSHKGERFCICLAPEASEYVHENMADNPFIFELVALLQKHPVTLSDVIALFQKYESTCIVKELQDNEFDVLIRFQERNDPYYYCFKDEGAHVIYHRFLPEDFRDLGLL